jgi:hypothetical protein
VPDPVKGLRDVEKNGGAEFFFFQSAGDVIDGAV